MDKKMVPEQANNPANSLSLDKNHGLHSEKRSSLSVSKLKIFLGALALSFVARGLSGIYMKSIGTQIERRFEISSSTVGLIDGSFEIGNLPVMLLVSYLGSRVHRPKVIAIGSLVMAIGAFTSATPYFIMGRYNYKSTVISVGNSSTSMAACLSALPPHPVADNLGISGNATTLGCEKRSTSYLWLLVLVGNILRGVGEAPIVPLGLSYIDDFAREENAAFYIGAVKSVGVLGPTFGFLLGAFCANMWVDIGTVDVDTLIINSKDIRWVGAWWLGFLICGATSVLTSLPYWFLPRSLPIEGEKRNIKEKLSDVYMITQVNHGFFPAVKKLLGNIIFLVFLPLNTLQYNIIAGQGSYDPKFTEQQFSISVSSAIFFIGIVLMPIALMSMFLGSFLIKRFKISVMGMAKFTCITFVVSFVFIMFYYMADCEVLQVAGLTVNYSGVKEPSFSYEKILSPCNSGCNCEGSHWDPVCGDNGITYMNACLAGCKEPLGTGKDMILHNCSCVGTSGPGNFSAILGECPREKCSKALPYFLAIKAISVFFWLLGATPFYMIMFRTVSPDLKSFAVGIETACGRIFGGLAAPIYFGALIDRTCLKWSVKPCGESGACRLYDTKAFRYAYFGLMSFLNGASILLGILLILLLKRVKPDNGVGKVSQSTEISSVKVPATATEESFSMEASKHKETSL